MSADALDRLQDMMSKAHRVVVFTGAGISTESGIPDFRSPGGLWTKYAPIDFQEFVGSEEMRMEAWRRKFAMDSTLGEAEPNKGHFAIAKMVDEGLITHVITQNIDGLHQASGVPASKVIELHGNATYATCLSCGQRHELADVRVAFEASDTSPRCVSCDGIVKSATISFGQSMPEDKMLLAQQATQDCDLMLAIGSSLQVYPAAGFPIMAKQTGAGLIILNREATELDHIADLVLHLEIGATLAPLVRLN